MAPKPRSFGIKKVTGYKTWKDRLTLVLYGNNAGHMGNKDILV
jgi:hypothetical protein